MAVMQFFEMDDYFEKKHEEVKEASTFATVGPYGDYKEIDIPSYISIGSSRDTYYDIGSIVDENTGDEYPILNLVDYYTRLAIEDIKNQDLGDLSPDAVGKTTADMSLILLNKNL